MAVVTAGARAGQRLQNRQPPGAQFTPHSNPARCLFFARLPPKPVANPDLSPDLSPDPSPNLSPDLGRSRGSPQPLGCASSGAPIFSLRKRCELPPRKNRVGYKLLRPCDFDSRCTTQQFLPPFIFGDLINFGRIALTYALSLTTANTLQAQTTVKTGGQMRAPLGPVASASAGSSSNLSLTADAVRATEQD